MLTQKEADMLIGMLKKTVAQEIEFPSAPGRVQFEAVGERRENRFVVNISRKGINNEGATYQGREKYKGIILLRLDVNSSGTHVNPLSREKITGTHLHVYTEEFEMKETVPFDVNNQDLYQLCFSFFDKFNIIEKPIVIEQQKLF